MPRRVHRLPLKWAEEPFLIEATFDAGSATEFGLAIRQAGEEGTRLSYDIELGELMLNRHTSGNEDLHPLFPSAEQAQVALVRDRLRLEIYRDAGSVEVFAQGGRVTFAEQVFPAPESTGLSVYAVGGTAQLIGLALTPFKGSPRGAGTTALHTA